MFMILSVLFCLVIYITLDLMENEGTRLSGHKHLSVRDWQQPACH